MALFCRILTALGGINWGLVGLFGFDAVAYLCGGSYSAVARVIYCLIAAAAVCTLLVPTTGRE